MRFRFKVQQVSSAFALDRYPALIEGAEWEPREWRDLLRALHDSVIFGAFVGDACVGLVRITGDLVYTALICDLIVEPKFGRMGVGTLLMERVLSYCMALGVKEAYAVVDWQAKGFYQQIKDQTNGEWMEAWRWKTGNKE